MPLKSDSLLWFYRESGVSSPLSTQTKLNHQALSLSCSVTLEKKGPLFWEDHFSGAATPPPKKKRGKREPLNHREAQRCPSVAGEFWASTLWAPAWRSLRFFSRERSGNRLRRLSGRAISALRRAPGCARRNGFLG